MPLSSDKISANRTGIVRSYLEGEEARSYDNPFTFVAYFPHSPVAEKYPDQPGMSKSREPLFILVRRKSRHEPSSNYCSCASRREVVTPTRFYNRRTTKERTKTTAAKKEAPEGDGVHATRGRNCSRARHVRASHGLARQAGSARLASLLLGHSWNGTAARVSSGNSAAKAAFPPAMTGNSLQSLHEAIWNSLVPASARRSRCLAH